MKRLSLAAVPAALFLFASVAFGWHPIVGSGSCDNSPGRGDSYVYFISGPVGALYDVTSFRLAGDLPDWSRAINGADFGPDGTAAITTNSDEIWVRWDADRSVVTHIVAEPKCAVGWGSPTPSPVGTPTPSSPYVGRTPNPTVRVTPPATATPDQAETLYPDGWAWTLVVLGGMVSFVATLVRFARRPFVGRRFRR